jgi:organic radical activating enzyme
MKGEGIQTGKPMFCIRLAGCNLRCKWCDTAYDSIQCELSVDELVVKASTSGMKHIVITGGEPLIHDLAPLCSELKRLGFKLHLETNGTLPVPSGMFDWIAASPKTLREKLSLQTLLFADEIKFVCGQPGWQDIIDSVQPGRLLKSNLFLMPLAKPYPYRKADGLIDENIQTAIKYCLANPSFSLCMQLHKILGIP